MSRDGGDSLADRILESPLTWFITAINLGIFFIAWQKGAHEGGSLYSETLQAFGAVHRGMIQERGEYWRLATAIFLHVGWIHLLWNTYGMFSWCAFIERKVGSAWFAFAYLTTGIGASAVSVLGNGGTAAGASGAGFGMVGMTLAFLYRSAGSWRGFKSDADVRWILKMTAIWFLIGAVQIVRMDNWAHGGGLVFGVACGFVLGSKRRQLRAAWVAGLGAYILVWTAVVVLACIPGMGLGG
jgi:rhomboid protease GluP